MKWSLFNWKKPVVSSGEPEDYQVVKNTVSQNERNITNINNQLMLVQNSSDRNSQRVESLENRVNRTEQSINNAVTTNTNQTISGTKTLSNTLTLTKTNGALAFKPGTNQASFIEFYNSTTRIGYMGKASSTNNNIQIGSEFGDIVLTPATNNGIVIPEPRNNNNPATKQYVDTKKTEATTYTDTKITETRNYIDTQISGINMVNSIRSQVILLADQSSNSTKTTFGPFVKDTITITTNQQGVRILSAVAQLNASGGDNLNTKIEFTYSATTNGRLGYLNFMYEGNTNDNTNWQFSTVTIWYVSSASSRIVDPFYIVQRGGNNEN